MNCMVLHGTVWYCMVQYGIAWYCMVQHGIAWYSMVLHGTAWYCMVQMSDINNAFLFDRLNHELQLKRTLTVNGWVSVRQLK